jgi:hypothetical protein
VCGGIVGKPRAATHPFIKYCRRRICSIPPDYPCSKRGHGLWNKIGCTSFQSLTRLRVTRLWHIKSPILKSGVVPIDKELLPVQSMAVLSGNHTCHACNGHISGLSHRYVDNYSGTLFGSVSTSIVPSIWRNDTCLDAEPLSAVVMSLDPSDFSTSPACNHHSSEPRFRYENYRKNEIGHPQRPLHS